MSLKWQLAADDLGVLTGGFEERLKATTSPRQRKILETLIEHLRTEGSGDLDGVMRTVSPAAEFLHPDNMGPKGWDEIRAYYDAMFQRGGIGNMNVRNQRIIVDDDAIVNEVTLVMVMPSTLAAERGYNVSEHEGHYAVWRRICTVLPFDDEGRLLGEITYESFINPEHCERVPDEQLTAGYREWLKGLPAT